MNEVRRYVVVSGPPGSGKSTIAPVLAERLQLPLLAKDTIKEALLQTLGAPDMERSRDLGRAAIATMYALAHASPTGAVIENVFARSLAGHEVAQLQGAVVEVFCRCDRDTALARYRERAPARSAGHFDVARSATDVWNGENAEPIAGGWPVVEADTNGSIDPAQLVDRVASSLAEATAGGTDVDVIDVVPTDPRFDEVLELARSVLEQDRSLTAVVGDALESRVVGAFADGRCVGFLRFLVQTVGSEDGRPPLVVDESSLTEGYVEAFGVDPAVRLEGVGSALQAHAIAYCRGAGCYQMRSRSPVTSVENYALKLAAGYVAHPSETNDSYYFLLKL